MEEEKQAEWKIKSAPERQILSEGRYVCTLTDVRAVDVPSFDDKERMEQKILFIFKPVEIDGKIEDGKDASITTFVSPSMGAKSKMYKLLCDLSPSGKLPKEAMNNSVAYKKYAESFIGKSFTVTSEPSVTKKYNNLKSVFPNNAGTVKVEEDDIPF